MVGACKPIPVVTGLLFDVLLKPALSYTFIYTFVYVVFAFNPITSITPSSFSVSPFSSSPIIHTYFAIPDVLSFPPCLYCKSVYSYFSYYAYVSYLWYCFIFIYIYCFCSRSVSCFIYCFYCDGIFSICLYFYTCVYIFYSFLICYYLVCNSIFYFIFISYYFSDFLLRSFAITCISPV